MLKIDGTCVVGRRTRNHLRFSKVAFVAGEVEVEGMAIGQG